MNYQSRGAMLSAGFEFRSAGHKLGTQGFCGETEFGTFSAKFVEIWSGALACAIGSPVLTDTFCSLGPHLSITAPAPVSGQPGIPIEALPLFDWWARKDMESPTLQLRPSYAVTGRSGE